MVPTSPASFVQIGALWIFFVPRVPPLHHFSFLVAQTPTRCKQTSKSLPSLFFWWSPQVLQVSSRLEHFEFFGYQGGTLWIISEFDKMQKKLHFLFFEIRTPFFDSILRTAPGTILNHSHQVWPPVLRRNQHFDARAFVSCCCSLLLNSKKWIFQNFFPIVILHEFYISCILRHHWYFSV